MLELESKDMKEFELLSNIAALQKVDGYCLDEREIIWDTANYYLPFEASFNVLMIRSALICQKTDREDSITR